MQMRNGCSVMKLPSTFHQISSKLVSGEGE